MANRSYPVRVEARAVTEPDGRRGFNARIYTVDAEPAVVWECPHNHLTQQGARNCGADEVRRRAPAKGK